MAAGMIAASLATLACMKENKVIPDDRPAGDGEVELLFSSGLAVENTIWTKVRNTVDVLEDKIIGAALAIYDDNGVLVHQDRADGEFSGFTKPVRLNKERQYSCYLVTGYIAGKIAFPDKEENMQYIEIENTEKNGSGVYDMTGTLRDFGPDRAGQILSMTPAGLDLQDGLSDGKVTIPVKSLWAKVSVSFDADAIDKVRVGLGQGGTQSCGAAMGNRVFKPFASGGGSNVSDRFALLPMETRTAVGGIPPAEPFVFFVPENMFGNLLPGNTESDSKTPAKVREKCGEITAIAVEKSAVTVSSPAYTDWGDTGTITFRFCLGDNTTSNFDIKRNTFYNVILTATANGFAIKDWKAELNVPDNRVLRLGSPVRKATGTSLRFSDTTFTQAGSTGSFFLIPNYTVRSADNTESDYDSSPGWRISDACRQRLAALGINTSFTKRYVYIKPSSQNVFFSETADADAAAVYYSGRKEKTGVLMFTPSSELASGTAIPVTVETHDGEHQATVTVQARADGTVVVEWEREPAYIAQQGLLKTTSMTGSVSSVSFSVPSQYSSYIDIDASSAGNNSCIVKARKAGDVFVEYTGKSSQGTEICSGSIPVSIKAPRLRAGTNICNLSPDGTAVTLSPYYISADGGTMTVAASDAQGYGDKFSPTLYNALLAPQVSFPDGPASSFLGNNGTQVYVALLSSGGRSVVSCLGNTYADAVQVSAKAAPDVTAALCDVFLKTPLGYNSSDVKLGTIENHVLTGLNTTHSWSTAVRKGDSVTVPGVSFTPGAGASYISIEGTGDMDFTPGSDGSLTVSGKSSGITSLTAGRHVLNAVCRNFRCNQSVSVPSGYLEVYLHTVPVAVLDLTPYAPEVSTDIAGADISPALASLRTALKADKNAVKCSFFNGLFYDLGGGLWNYIDEVDSSGNQIEAPDQSGLLTVFEEVSWPGMIRIGDKAYIINIGSIEQYYGKYNSMATFLSWNENPHLLLDYSALTSVSKSPFNNTMYHYNYDTAVDSYGYSYYILDFIYRPLWKQ